MRRKITLFVFTCLIARCYSQGSTKCNVDDPEGHLDWQTFLVAVNPIKDSESLDLQITYSGDFHVVADTEEEGAKYIDITADGSTLSIKTNDYFKNNYEEDQRDQAPASSLTIYRTLSITCDGTTYQFTIQLYVQDTNNHSPTFVQDTYTYTMPMPLVPNIDLTNFGNIEIIVEDIDFSNTKMSFAVDPPEYFSLDFKALPSRQYHAVLKVTQYVRYDKDLTLTITATDETDPFHTDTATVVIKKDAEFSQPDIPTFSELIYAFTYSNDGGNPAITPDDPSKQIVVTTSDSDQTEVSLSDETYFKAEYDKTTNTVTISVTDIPVESASESMMTLTLTVKLGSESSESAIIVKLPSNVVVIIPKFTAPYYTATYSVDGDGNPSLALDAEQEIAITQQTSNLDIELEGDDHFSIANVDGVWTLNADSPLDDEILKKGEDITLTLHATVTDENSEEHEGFGVVIVKLPPVLEVPRFVEANYRGQYKVDEAGVKDTVELTNGPINIVQTEEPVDIVIVDNAEYFALIQGSDGWTVDVLKKWEQVTEGGDIVLTLSATVTGADVEPGYSTLIIGLPAATEAPTFDKPYYTATYKTGTDKDTLEVQDSINVAGGPDTDVKILESETNSQFFKAELNDDKSVTVSLTNNLDLKTILGDVDIVLTLQATDPKVTEVGTATLVVKLPKEVTPAAFTQAHYTGSYDVDSDPDVVKINEAIELSGNYLDSTTVVLVTPTGLQDNFKLSDASPYTITLTSDIDDVHSYNEIVLTLEASIDGVPRKTSATVVIEVPAIPLPPKFSYSLYEFKYDSDTVTSTDGKTITTDPSDTTAVKVVIGDPYTKNFKISPVGDAGEYKFEVTTPLDQTIIDQNVEIFVQLDATLTGSTDTSSATVAIKMPEKTENVVPKFSNAYYKATYTHNDPDEDIVTIQDPVPITIASDQASDTVVNVIGQYQENFKAEFNTDTNSWGIKVTSKLDDTTLSLLELVIPLEAVLSGAADVGSAALVLSLPDSEKDPIPLFEKPSYTAQYSLNDDGTPNVTGDPIVVKVADLTYAEVTLADYTDYFVLTPNGDKSQWIISSSSKALDDDTLKNNLELVIQLNAHLDSAVADGAAVLVVTLPHQSITFDAPKYQGAYKHDSEDSTKDSVDIADITIQPAGASASIQNNAYPDNFDIQCDDEGKCNLQLKAPLEDTVLTSEKEIILVLEASKADTTATSTAAVIISLPLLETLDAPEFTENVYVAQYVVDEETGAITITPDNPIQIKGETDLNDFNFSLDGDNSDHFNYNFNVDHWDIINSEPLPDETLKNEVSILLNLKATKPGVSVPGLAGLVIQLPKSTDPEILSFTQVAYIANYTVVTGNNNDVLDITNGPVKFDGVDDASTVKPDVVEDEYKDYFSITPETDGWTIAMLKDFSSEITDQISLTVTLKATLDDRSGECALVISLPKKVSPASFQFEFPTYRAEYEQVQDGKDKVSFAKSITLTGDVDGVTVEIDGDYATYFVETNTGNTVSIEVNKDLPDDVLDKVAITLDIVASKSNEKATSTAVINLPRKVVPSTFYFDSGVYTGTYNEDDTFALDSDQKISLTGDIDHSATFAANGDYAEYFDVSYDGEEIKVTLTKALPSEVVEQKITIPVEIVATREGVHTPTTLIVKLPKNSAPATFYFEHNVYTVQYKDDDDSLVQPDINIEGDSDNKASVKLISSDYAKYFDAGYTNGAVKLTVKEPITDEIIAEKGAITVDLEATSSTDEVATATVVIELPKRNTAATFYFDSTIYEASYNDDGVTVNGSITLTGDSDSTATVEVQGEYADDFTVTYTDNTVELSLTKTLPSDVLDTYAAITVDIVATRGSETATTTVVITLPKKIVPASFSFNSTHYVGDYKVDDNGNTLAVSAISLKGETENVKVTIEGEYSDHFSVGYASGNVNISLKKPLDSDILDTKSAIPLDLKAVKADETVITTLVITLPKEASVGDSEDDKTGLIAAVAVLAVLLVASLVGSAVFYYFKFRRGSSYNDIDEGRPSERFRKNSTTDSKKVEHPTRRATGVIKYPLEEVAENGETPTEEMEPNLEKRKSVQFDTINIDELEIEKPEDDDNDFMGDSEAEDGDDTRRTSRV